MRQRETVAPLETRGNGMFTTYTCKGYTILRPDQVSNVRWTPSMESISDTVGSPGLVCGTSRVSRMKGVEHWKSTLSVASHTVDLNHYLCSLHPTAQNRSTVSVMWPMWRYSGFGSLDLLSLHESVFWGNFSLPSGNHFYDHWVKAKPSMATRANLAVFLGELRDCKRMFDLLPKKYFSLDNWREVIRYGNGLHLNWNFGWRPFVTEIASIMKGLRTFEARLNKFLGEQNQLLRRHEADAPVTGTIVTPWTTLGLYYGEWRYKWDWTYTIRSTFQFSYTLPPFSYESLRWRAYLDSLGMAGSAADVWALLPWSFVVDWFFAVGKYLDTFTEDWISPWIVFCQGCNSIRLDATGGFEWAYQHPSLEFPKVYFPKFTDHSLRYYRRTVGVPKYVWDHPDDLSADKIRLLASLIASLIV